MNKWFESDWVLRIASVGIAILFWLIVTHSFPFQQDDQTAIQIDDVKVETRYDKTRFAVASIDNRRVQLTLSGNKKALSSIPPYQVFVDLTKLKAGKNQTVAFQVKGLPDDIKVKISPKTTKVSLEQQTYREFPVEVSLRGKKPTNEQLDQTIVNPERVLVRGTASQLDRIQSVKGRVDLTDASFPLKKWISLQPFDTDGQIVKGVSVSPETVKVSVTTKKQTKDLPLTYEIVTPPPTGVTIEQIVVTPQNVTISGDADKLTEITTFPPVRLDLSQVSQDQTITYPLQSVLPELKTTPKQANVKVILKKQQE